MRFPVTGLLVLLALAVAACAPVLVTQPDRLVFQPEIFDDLTGEFVFSLKVRNDGDGVSPARSNANARMELRDEHGLLRASAQVTSLIAIEPGVILDPAAWRGRLDPGSYQLYWGAPGLGHTQIHFVVDEVDGRPRLGDMRIIPLPDQDMPTLPTYGDAQPLVDLATAQLAGQLGAESGLIRVERVEPVDFPDASLGAPQPDMMYAQVVTPGYVIELSHQGQSFVFHGSGQQVVPVPAEDAGKPPEDAGKPPEGSITIESVQVDGEQVTVRGRSTLPDGTCLGSELWAGGELAAWWPDEACARVDRGAWQLVVPLGVGQAPAALDPDVQYMLRAFLPGGPNIVSVFAFDLARPTAGSATIFGHDIVQDSVAIRERIGYLPQQPRFVEHMSARENLRLAARFFFSGPAAAIEDRCAEMLAVLALLIALPALVTYVLYALRLGAPQPLAPFLAGVGIMTVHTLFYLALVVLLGVLFDVRPLILGVSLGTLLAGTLLSGLIKPLLYVTPWILPKAASLAAAGQPVPLELLWPPLLASALWSLIFVLGALVAFEKTEF